MAEIAERILLKGNGREYQMRAWVIMPNHVHLVADVWDVPLANMVNAWKGKSSRLANLALRRRGHFWQEDYFLRRVFPFSLTASASRQVAQGAHRAVEELCAERGTKQNMKRCSGKMPSWLQGLEGMDEHHGTFSHQFEPPKK